MKDEEMAEQFADNISGLELTCSVLASKDKNHAYRLGRYDGFLAGLKAGRPQWHKVTDGDLPKDKEYVLVYTDLNNYYVAEKVDNHFMAKGWGFIPMSTVVAWCEIPTFDKE